MHSTVYSSVGNFRFLVSVWFAKGAKYLSVDSRVNSIHGKDAGKCTARRGSCLFRPASFLERSRRLSSPFRASPARNVADLACRRCRGAGVWTAMAVDPAVWAIVQQLG